VSAYPRYINGNPVTGTAGSIPPATSIDEDQIEILNVIINAGLTPTHSDLTQLWQALQALFAQRYITTVITKTVHGSGADFPDLIQAMRWLAQYIITQTGYVTFMCANGKWTYTQAVELNHPNINRVAIQGGALLGGTPQPNNFSITAFHNSADGTNHIIYLRSVHATELSFTGGVNGFVVQRGGCILRYLLISGSQTIASGPSTIYGNSTQGNGIWCDAQIFVDGVSIWGFGSCGIYITNTGWLAYASSLSLVCSYNGWQGISASGNITGSANCWTILVSNGVSGITVFGATTWFDKISVKGHGPPLGNAAVQCEQGGLVTYQPGSEIKLNQSGVILAGAATLVGEGTSYIQNTTYGLYVHGGASVWVDDSNFTGNAGTFPIICSHHGIIEALRSTFDKETSPPRNTEGNIGGYIYA